MKEIGVILKAAREEKGLSLDEVQMVTKIRYKHLVALEAGDFDQLPGEVYVKGFLVNFANAVGLNGEEILQKYYALKDQASADTRETQNAESEMIWPEPVPPEKGARPAARGKTPFYILVSIVGLLLAGAIIFWILQGREPAAGPVTVSPSAPASETGTVPVASGQTATETRDLPGGAGGRTEPATGTPAPSTSKQTESPAATLPVLVVEADEVVWMGIYRRASGALLFEGTLYPDERREWILTEDVTLRIGNAGGLRISYRGQDLGKLGASGQVVTKVITVE